MYFGSNGNEAVHHVIQEIISNAIDEHLAGHGDKIQIIAKDNTIVIRDFARGIPFGKITEIATVPHSSGKFKDSENGNDAYLFSGGLNGIGLKLATATGTLTIISFRNGKMKKGVYRVDSIEEFDEKETDQANGTLVSWCPDPEPFKSETDISSELIQSKLETLSYLLPKMVFELHDGQESQTIQSKGMLDLFEDYLYSENCLIKPYHNEYEIKNGKQRLEVKAAFTFNSKNNIERSYVNLIPTPEHGSHITAFKTVLTRQFNSYFSTDFSGDEIRKHLSFIIAVNTTLEPTFVGQAKSQLKMPEINTDLNSIYKEMILDMFENRKKEFQTLVKMMEKIKKASDVDKILKQITGKKKEKTGLANVSSKYSGCQRDEGIELFLTEGLSAKGGLELSKSPVYQAVYAMKGKILNCFSKELEEVIKNDEIQEIIAILGDSKTAVKKFKKIIIAADADHDGSQIVNLTLGFLATFYKELFFKGLIYVPVLPKYIARKEEQVKFMFDDEEKSKIPKSWDIGYLKGLGINMPL